MREVMSRRKDDEGGKASEEGSEVPKAATLRPFLSSLPLQCYQCGGSGVL